MIATQPVPEDLEDPLEDLANTLARQIQLWAPDEGITSTAIPGLELMRANAANSCMGSTVYDPALCLIAQGGKTVWLGDRQIEYGPLSCMVSTVHLPVLGKVIDASPEKPYLGVKITVEPQEVTDLVLAMGESLSAGIDEECPDGACGLSRVRAEKGMVEAVLRLVSLLESPRDSVILAPLIRREILYRALVGELGVHMRKFAVADTQTHRMAKVIAVLKDRFAEPLRVRDLADMVNMSESSLFHSFKQVTRMSPLQFQKRLRLHEARRLMLSEGMEAATASFRVGYGSPSHFSREYSRMFGVPPRADVVKLRGELPQTARA
ncbi:AraC family transcriptional regulator [Salinicola peritrichatus]|uniref:AraC family transcriptional regulator n=1 Tax=Salinicola peritrichatus TaxID=1267424 RepID=UPI000DA187AA|nr:AraC family transcriptional regulator [Salinicola peritrichatus]